VDCSTSTRDPRSPVIHMQGPDCQECPSHLLSSVYINYGLLTPALSKGSAHLPLHYICLANSLYGCMHAQTTEGIIMYVGPQRNVSALAAKTEMAAGSALAKDLHGL
jgi:hypothetical protein